MKTPNASTVHPNPDPFIRQAYLGRTGLPVTLLALVASLASFGVVAALAAILPHEARDSDGGYAYVFRDCVDTVAYLAGILLSIRFVLRRPLRSVMTAGRRFWPTGLWYGAFTCIGLAWPLSIAWLWAQPIGLEPWSNLLRGGMDAEWLACLAVEAVLITPLGALAEELVFRGFLTQLLGDVVRNRIGLAAIIALVFTIVHGWNGAGPSLELFAMSMTWSAVTFASGGIEWAVGYHTAINVIITLSEYLLSAVWTDRPRYEDILVWSESVLYMTIAGSIFLYLARRDCRATSSHGRDA